MPSCMLSFSDVDSIVQCLPSLKEKICEENQDEELSANQKSDAVVFGFSSDAVRRETVTSLGKYFMWICRKYNLLKNERMTLLSNIDELVVLQLCLAEKNKQKTGDFDIEASTVIHNHNKLVQHKLSKIGDEATKQSEEDPTTSESAFDISFNSLMSPDCGDVIDFSQYEDFLSHGNTVDLCDILSLVHKERQNNEELNREICRTLYVFNGLPKGQVQRAMVKLLTRGREVMKFSVEVPLDGETDEDDSIPVVTFHEERMNMDQLLCQHSETSVAKSTVKKKKSVTACHLDVIFMSYLEILVNSRSELALARVINTPERGLSHSAFTDLKHEASTKGMTMYQTAVSYIMRLRLGGKGYASDSGNTLAPHVKGLGDFVSMVQRIQTVIEEDPEIRSACRRVLNIIKREMIKCRDSKFKSDSVEAVTDQLQCHVTRIVDECENFYANTPEKGNHNGGSLRGRRTVRVLSHLLDRLVTRVDNRSSLYGLDDAFSSQGTPMRFPSLLSQFRSPDEEEEEDDAPYNISLSERLSEKQNNLKNTKMNGPPYKSHMDWAVLHDNNEKLPDVVFEQTEIVVPSKTIIHPGCNTKAGLGLAKTVEESRYDQENIRNETEENAVVIETVHNKERGQKRQLLDPSQSQSQPPAKKKAKPKEKSCRRKLLPQVKGQQKLTGFFRV
ncbi:hypothetical protein ScPMuIL_006673 [Solemya velum]